MGKEECFEKRSKINSVIDKYIYYVDNLYQVESVVIQANIKVVWQEVLNLDKNKYEIVVGIEGVKKGSNIIIKIQRKITKLF